MAIVDGQRTTSNQASVQRYIDIARPINRLEPEATPLTVLMQRMNERVGAKMAGDPEFSWTESERETRWDAINNGAGYSESAEELKVDDEEAFAPNMLITSPRTGEIMFVTEIVEAGKIKVTRGYSGTSKAALEDDDPLFVIAQVAEEGSRSFEARTQNPDKVTNNTQIWKTPVAISGTAESSLNQTSPHDWVYQQQEKMREHMLGIELAALFGSKGSTTGPSEGTLRTTAGLLYFLTANNQDAGGTLTETEFESWVRSICRHGNMKTVLCSPLLLSVINNYAVGRLQTIQADMDKTYGLSITKYQCAHGELNLVKHNLLEGAVWGGYGIAVDFEKSPPRFRPLGGGPGGSRNTKVMRNRAETDRDGRKDEVLTEGGFEVPLPKRHGVLTGVTG